MENTKPQLALIGGGKMGRALVQGMIDAGFTTADRVTVGDHNPVSQAWWKQNVPQATVTPDSKSAVEGADVVLLAIKPRVVLAAVSELKRTARKSLLISVAAGIPLDALVRQFGSSRVIRVMPNTPSLVGAGASAYCCGDDVSSEDAAFVDGMLSSVGKAFRVDDKAMDAVTGLSGSGPAFVCMIIEALADGGVLSGLPRELSMQLATQTVLGTAKLVQQTGTHPGELKDAVASPGGTTIAGIAALERGGLRNTMISAVETATRRSEELGKN
ncbi:Pyrroline-5-carboxylate reductase [Rosistilla carotiformis]|uniref:Pyrroline-5-carboxylate reductase n=1 Tax=Rosistilla carotiformis TaxID=2528017 RepID=A0A518JRV2_9BACT|nr:pyrroline-5-carboxylate reductase [Rosistilla carotiformis]QDV68245.1 Pyrroline-5-carboxylate reductase [Rosistilla carotiformis]